MNRFFEKHVDKLFGDELTSLTHLPSRLCVLSRLGYLILHTGHEKKAMLLLARELENLWTNLNVPHSKFVAVYGYIRRFVLKFRKCIASLTNRSKDGQRIRQEFNDSLNALFDCQSRLHRAPIPDDLMPPKHDSMNELSDHSSPRKMHTRRNTGDVLELPINLA